MFFLGMRFDPPLAGITARRFISFANYDLSSLIESGPQLNNKSIIDI